MSTHHHAAEGLKIEFTAEAVWHFCQNRTAEHTACGGIANLTREESAGNPSRRTDCCVDCAITHVYNCADCALPHVV
jgi:hypothetical protein